MFDEETWLDLDSVFLGKQRFVRIASLSCLDQESSDQTKIADSKNAMLLCSGPARQGSVRCLCVAYKVSTTVVPSVSKGSISLVSNIK